MPFRKPCLAVIVVALTVATWSVAAQRDGTLPADAFLQGLVDEALAQNAALLAARQMETAARAVPAQAGSRPGPMLGVFYANDGVRPSLGREPMTRLGVSAAQEIPYPGKLAGRRRIAETDAAMAAFDVERARLRLIAGVKSAYYGLVLARGLATLALDHREVWRQIHETARVRYASAAGPLQELLRAQVEETRLQALHVQHHAEARARRAQLNALLRRPIDTPLDTPLEASESLPALAETRTREEVAAWAEARSPELQAAALGVEREERALALARLQGKPDFTVQAGYMHRGSLPPMWEVGGSVGLPSKSRAKAAVAEAEASLSASQARLVDVRVRLRAVVEQRMALIDAAEQIAATYRDGLLPQADLSVRAALARYAAGEGSQGGVLEAAAAVVEDRIDYLRLLATQAVEVARLEEASLEDPTGIDALLMHGRGAVPAMSSAFSPPDGLAGRESGAGMEAR